jgi:protein subunit release factor B
MDFPVVLPPQFIDKARELKVFPEDVREQFVRGSGKGGQKVNKTSSTVLLVHAPTGITVRCQKHREQSNNRISAYKLLILKVEEKIKGAASARAQKIEKTETEA